MPGQTEGVTAGAAIRLPLVFAGFGDHEVPEQQG